MVESRTSVSCLLAEVRALIAVHSTRSIAIAASARCRNIAVAAPPSVGTSLPSIRGQSVNTSWASLARTYVPTKQQKPDDGRGDQGETREGWVPALVDGVGVDGPDGARHVRHVGDQDQGGHEVRGHPPGIELRRHHHGAEPGLDQHQREREDRWPEQRRLRTSHADRGESGERGQHDHEERHPAVGELDQRMDRPGGEQVTGLAGGPGGAPQAGARPAHQAPDREQDDRGDRGGEREGTEPGPGDQHRDHG